MFFRLTLYVPNPPPCRSCRASSVVCVGRLPVRAAGRSVWLFRGASQVSLAHLLLIFSVPVPAQALPGELSWA